MKSLAGTKTEQNLLKAFAGESQARNRYEFFASQAKKEEFEQIAALFLETAGQEKEHAKRFFKFLEEGRMVEITASYPAGKIGTTAANLKAAASGENEEWTVLYPEFAKVAREEGFTEIAVAFTLISKVEAEHEKRYLKLLKNIESNQVFTKPEKTKWVCRNCGHVQEGTTAPGKCPCCLHPQAFFEEKAENY